MRFRHEAINNLYPNVITSVGNKSYDSSGALVKVDEDLVLKENNKLQKEFDGLEYQRDRESLYPELAEQFDLLWHAIDDGKFNVKSKDTDFYKKLKAVKDAKPKSS